MLAPARILARKRILALRDLQMGGGVQPEAVFMI